MSGDRVAQTMAGRMCEPGELFGMCVLEVRNLETAVFERMHALALDVDALREEMGSLRGGGVSMASSPVGRADSFAMERVQSLTMDVNSLRQDFEIVRARATALPTNQVDLVYQLQEERAQRNADFATLQQEIMNLRECSRGSYLGGSVSDSGPPQVLQVNIAEIAELRREVDDLRIPTTAHLLPPQQEHDVGALLTAVAAMEETVAGIRRDMKVDQDDQDRRAQTTQLTLSLLRTDLSALKLSHEEALAERQQPMLTDTKRTNDTSTDAVQLISASQESLRKNVLQELSLIREEMEKDRLVSRRQFATMRERMEACERVELDAGQDCLPEPMLLRGRVEALMSSRAGQKDLVNLASLSESPKKYPADLMAFIDKLQDVDRRPAHAFPNAVAPGAGELVALSNDMATLRRRLEHVEQDSALKINRLFLRVDAVEQRSTYAGSSVMCESTSDTASLTASLTARVEALEALPLGRRSRSPSSEDSLNGQARDKGVVSRRVREIEANLQVELNSHMRSLDLDLHKKVLAEIDLRISKEMRRLDISQIGPRIAHLEKEVSRHSVLFPTVR